MTDPSFTYLVQSLPWALAGFLAGCLTTRKVRIPATSAHMETPMTSSPDMPAPPPRRRFRITALHFMAVIVVVLTILSAVQSWLAQQANDRLTKCLVSYANTTADSIEVRSKAASEAQVAQIEVWRAIFQQAPTAEGRANALKLFQDYLDKQTAAIQTQKQHPYPPPPRDVCPAEANGS